MLYNVSIHTFYFSIKEEKPTTNKVAGIWNFLHFIFGRRGESSEWRGNEQTKVVGNHD